jgi:hypothetical protein
MLRNLIARFLSHKLHLAEVSSFYKRAEAKQAVMWGYQFSQWLKYQGKHCSDRDIAIELLKCKQHLNMLLPCPENKSFDSSKDNLTKILNQCSALLQPKQQVNGNYFQNSPTNCR